MTDSAAQNYQLFFSLRNSPFFSPYISAFVCQLPSGKSLVYESYDSEHRFLYKLTVRCVKLGIESQLKNNGITFGQLDISVDNQEDDTDLMIETVTKNKL